MAMKTGMVRKQLYIRSDQEAALKRAAQAQGVSEAELVREALDVLLQGADPSDLSRQQALNTLIASNLKLSQQAQRAAPYHFDRETLYEDREGRWT